MRRAFKVCMAVAMLALAFFIASGGLALAAMALAERLLL